jgi:hypothetical protein
MQLISPVFFLVTSCKYQDFLQVVRTFSCHCLEFGIFGHILAGYLINQPFLPRYGKAIFCRPNKKKSFWAHEQLALPVAS